jgi:hypothetical protein
VCNSVAKSLPVAASSVWPTVASCGQLWLTYTCCGQPVLTAWTAVCSLVSLHAWRAMVRVGMHMHDRHGPTESAFEDSPRKRPVCSAPCRSDVLCSSALTAGSRGVRYHGIEWSGRGTRDVAAPILLVSRKNLELGSVTINCKLFACKGCLRACALGTDGEYAGTTELESATQQRRSSRTDKRDGVCSCVRGRIKLM